MGLCINPPRPQSAHGTDAGSREIEAIVPEACADCLNRFLAYVMMNLFLVDTQGVQPTDQYNSTRPADGSPWTGSRPCERSLAANPPQLAPFTLYSFAVTLKGRLVVYCPIRFDITGALLTNARGT